MTKLITQDGMKFRCNHPGCAAELITTYHNRSAAWKRARAVGWKLRFYGEHPRHFCGWIHARAWDAQHA